jgi:diadenylate cyclase
MGFVEFRIKDLIDIILVAVFIYYFLSFIKGTRAIQMMIGLVTLLSIGVISSFLRLESLLFIFKAGGAAWIIIFVILFQPELRTAFAKLGRTRIGRVFFLRESKGIMKEIVKGVKELTKKGHGGIIVIEQNISCNDYIATGHKLDAKISSELIVSIFNPNSPLHDGAIIIKDDIIIASSCILPLAEGKFSPKMGTRHRAALGALHETDAICIVISEERREISLGYNKELIMNFPEDKLLEKLIQIVQ